MSNKTYTTTEAAAKIGVTRQTLYSWIDGGFFVPPALIRLGKKTLRMWTSSDIEKARKVKGTLKAGKQKSK